MKTQTGVPNSPQAGRAGGWNLKNAGLLSPVQKWTFWTSFLLLTCPGAKLGQFGREAYLCSLGPSIQWKKNWGKRTSVARVESKFLIFHSGVIVDDRRMFGDHTQLDRSGKLDKEV